MVSAKINNREFNNFLEKPSKKIMPS
uniref:Uncharacterized protein n=1 Tax=Lepeophtheirus salmonis TaxID=72036 RepID=A0A0K2SVA3_LEPSM